MANHVVAHWCRAYALIESAPTPRLCRMFARLTGGQRGAAYVRGCTRTLFVLLLKSEIDWRRATPFSEN